MKYFNSSVFPAYLLCIFLSFFLTSCDKTQQKKTVNLDDKINDTELAKYTSDKHHTDSLIFGFDLRSSPQEDARQYLPFLKYLETTTGYHFKLRFTAKNSSIIDELGKDKIQFAAIGAESFIKAKEKYQVNILVRGINSRGKSEYQSIIVVHPNSKIKNIHDLKGKQFAFGDIHSTQGHLIPRIILLKHHIGLIDFISYEYTGSHVNCVNSVMSGNFDACGMQDTMAREMASQGLVRILYTSPYYPSSGIAANKNVAPEILAKVKKALLSFDPQGQHRQGLYHWDKTEMPNGFAEALAQDYAELRKWSISLGLLKPINSTSQNE